MSPISPTGVPPSANPHYHPNPLLGITYKIVSVLLMLVMSALVKALSEVPTGQIVFARSFGSIIPIACFLAVRGELGRGLKTQHIGGHFLRGFAGVCAMACIFGSLIYLPLPDATAITYAVPLLVVVLGVFFLHEPVGRFRWATVFAGFAGVMIIVWPNLTLSTGFSLQDPRNLGIMLALGGVVLSGIVQLTVRKLTRTESSPTIVLYFAIVAGVVSLLTLPFGWVMPNITQLTFLVLIGVIGGVGELLGAEAYRHADLAVIAPFQYSSLIFSIIIGFFIFSEIPTFNMLIGGLIVTASGIAIIWREHQLRLQARQYR